MKPTWRKVYGEKADKKTGLTILASKPLRQMLQVLDSMSKQKKTKYVR